MSGGILGKYNPRTESRQDPTPDKEESGNAAALKPQFASVARPGSARRKLNEALPPPQTGSPVIGEPEIVKKPQKAESSPKKTSKKAEKNNVDISRESTAISKPDFSGTLTGFGNKKEKLEDKKKVVKVKQLVNPSINKPSVEQKEDNDDYDDEYGMDFEPDIPDEEEIAAKPINEENKKIAPVLRTNPKKDKGKSLKKGGTNVPEGDELVDESKYTNEKRDERRGQRSPPQKTVKMSAKPITKTLEETLKQEEYEKKVPEIRLEIPTQPEAKQAAADPEMIEKQRERVERLKGMIVLETETFDDVFFQNPSSKSEFRFCLIAFGRINGNRQSGKVFDSPEAGSN